MITVINKTNKGLYNQLFENVQNWLYTHNVDGDPLTGDDIMGPSALLQTTNELVFDPQTETWVETENQVPETITSLEELFAYMRWITNFAPIYTRLPLDEEPFFIDANARTISVPSNFSLNGVSVQGDEVSEILFFKINRFFDAQDFDLCDIYIQWKSSETDEWGNQKEGVSKPWIKDIESEPGYLIFGWPISSKITKEAGPVTFSVRLYRLDEADDKLVYSFSTLDQTVTVKPALDYDIEDIAKDVSKVVVDDMEANLILRADNSRVTNANVIAKKPEWEPGIEAGLEGWTVKNKEDGTLQYQVMNLALDQEGFSNEAKYLVSAATSDDSGIISYTWVKVNKEGNADLYCADGVTRFYRPLVYRIIENPLSITRNPAKTYYTLEEGGKYKAIPNETSFDTLVNEEGKDIYEAVSIATVDEVGIYTARAENRVGKVFSEPLVSKKIYVPQPKTPILGELSAKNSENKPILVENDTVSLSLDVLLTDEFDNNVGIENRGGKATYVWHRQALDAATPEDLDFARDELVLTDPETEEGYYSVTVTNNLNKEQKSDSSNQVRVTKPAVKLAVARGNAATMSIADAQLNGISVSVSGQEGHRRTDLGDDITYQWYAYFSHGNVADEDRALAETGNYEVHGDKIIAEFAEAGDALTERVIESSTEPTFYPPIDGDYFCLVTNIYNGTETTTVSPFYNITK